MGPLSFAAPIRHNGFMTTNEPEGVPPVPNPPTDAAHPAPEAAPATPAAATPPAASTPPAAPAYGPGTPEQPYGATPAAAQPAYGAQQPYGGAPYQSGPALPKGLSITAMITGIVGVVLGTFGWGFLPAVAGVIFGHIGQRREPHAKPFWLTGIITGYVGIALNLLWMLFWAVIFFVAISETSSSSF